ncbi:MAG: hypothetical protein AB1488_09560 [Nitrospirota bacterium]
MKINYMLKVEDAKITAIQKALEAANIKVRSIIEVYKELEEHEKVGKEERSS